MINITKKRNNGRYCNMCGKLLSNWEKAKNNDAAIPKHKWVCTIHAFILAQKYLHYGYAL